MQAQAISPKQGLAFVERLQRDPVCHIRDVQGITTLEPYQERIARAIAGYERVAVSACHDVGKSFTFAKIALWFGSAFPGSRVITTAPTFNQVKNILWAEMRAGHRKSKYPLGGEMLQTQWKIAPDWFAIGFSPQKTVESGEGQGSASTFQGFHAKYVLVLFDESTGIPKQIWDQAEGMLTSGFVRFAAIGNPTSRSGEFYKCFSSASWHKIKLSCFDSPNLKANGITDMEALVAELDYLRSLPEFEQQARLSFYRVVQPFLLSVSWVMRKALDWGIDHPLFISKVLGEFPEEDEHTLITLGSVEQAQLRSATAVIGDRYAIGVDTARFGTDKSVITLLHGQRLHKVIRLVKRDTSEVSGSIIREIETLGSFNVVITVDGTGIGAGVVDALRQAQTERVLHHAIQIREAHFGSGFGFVKNERKREEFEKKYVNRKALMFVRLAQDLRENLILNQDSVYLEELPTIHYRFDSKGRYVIESKDEYKKRTGRSSPDDADSLALANDSRYDESEVGTFTSDMVSARQGFVPALSQGDVW